MKKEFVRQRPKWLVRLLLKVPTKVYEVCDTLDDVKAHLQTIYDTIHSSNLLEKNQKLHLKGDDLGFSINSNKDRAYIKFTINKDYYKV